jgi:hypothetical protein
MIFRTRAPLAIAAASLLAMAACESATNSNENAEGTVSFSYAGAHAGAFSASGSYDRLRPSSTNWAVGNRGQLETGEQAMGVYARSDRDDDLVDDFLLFVTEPTVGTFTCTADAVDTCPVGAFLILGTTLSGDESEAIYSSVSGTVNITSINEDRASGNFVLTMEAFTLEPSADSVQVTSGSFNVPLIPTAGFN